jgi:(S)-citramalyl-CoA lyase
MPASLRFCRSALFVPGSRPERFAKAAAADPDLVIIDLEDAVAADQKAAARDAALAYIATHDLLSRVRWAVRMNGLKTTAGLEDALALAEAGADCPRMVFVPKVESAAELDILASILPGDRPGFVPLVESPEGMRHAYAIAEHPRVAAVMLGGADFCAELGVPLSWEPLALVRGTLAAACARVGKPLLDVPWIHLKDADGLRSETERVKALGFTAKTAIHPDQISTINTVFTPTDGEIAKAREALAVFQGQDHAAMQHNGAFLEAPIIRRYERVLEIAARLAN